MLLHLYQIVGSKTWCQDAFDTSFQTVWMFHFYKTLIVEMQNGAGANRKWPLNKIPVWSSNSDLRTNEHFPKMHELEGSSCSNN